MGHHHDDFSAEVLFIELEGFFAVTAVVEISMQFHCVVSFWLLRATSVRLGCILVFVMAADESMVFVSFAPLRRTVEDHQSTDHSSGPRP